MLVAVLVIGLLVGALLTAFGAANWDYAQCQRDVLSEIEVLAYCFVPGSLVMAMGLLIVTASVVGLLVVAPSIPVDSTADSGAGEVGAAQRDGGSWLPFVLTAAVAVVAVAVAIALGRWG